MVSWHECDANSGGDNSQAKAGRRYELSKLRGIVANAMRRNEPLWIVTTIASNEETPSEWVSRTMFKTVSGELIDLKDITEIEIGTV